MQDTTLKNTGNSRTLASVPNFLTLYPTYEAFGKALVNRELPIDIGPLNPAGVDTMGTMLDTAALLKDTTAALYGLDETAVPDDVLAKIQPLIAALQGGKANVAIGTYVGTGTYGPSNKSSLTFPFSPKCVMILDRDGNLKTLSTAIKPSNGFCFGNVLLNQYNNPAMGVATIDTTWETYTLYWWTTTTKTNAQVQQSNGSGTTYTYIAIG